MDFSNWNETLDAVAAGDDEAYGDEVFDCNLGKNHDIPLQPAVTHVPNLAVDEAGNTESQGLLVDMSTSDITSGSLVAKFHLRQYGDKDCVQVVVPTSHELCAKQEPEIEKGCEQIYWKDGKREAARKKTNTATKDDDKMEYVHNYAFLMPKVFCPKTGKELSLHRKYYHEKDGEPADCTKLRVARKLVPGNIEEEGRYVKVKGYRENDGKVPVSKVHYSFQLAYEGTEQKIDESNDDAGGDEDDSDEDLADMRRATA